MAKAIIYLFSIFVLTLSCSTGFAEPVNVKLVSNINQNFQVDLQGTGKAYDANIKFVGEAGTAMYILTLYNQTETFEFKLPSGSGFLSVVNPLGEKREDILYVINDAKNKSITEVQVLGWKNGVVGSLLDPNVDKVVGKNGRIESDLLGPVLVFESELALDGKAGRPLQRWAKPLKWDSRSGFYKYGESEKVMNVHTRPSVQFQADGWVRN